jgi:spore coat polysaccharide biosynthesis protein SpsF
MTIFGAIIQARHNSSRLPGKMSKDLHGKPLIARVVEQISYSECLDNVIVATSDEESDDVLANLCESLGINYYRGSLNNVLKRFIDTAEHFNLDVIIRVTGDNPLTDPVLIDSVISEFKNDPKLEYINNVHRNGSVHGSGCELVTLTALKRVYDEVKNATYNNGFLEHVTFYIRKNADRFNTMMFYPDAQMSRPEISYSVDYPEDFTLVEILYKNLYHPKKPFKTKEVLEFLDQNPSLLEINSSLHDELPDY